MEDIMPFPDRAAFPAARARRAGGALQIRCLLMMALVVAGAATAPQHAAAQTTLMLEKFSERLSKDVPVSGRKILVGAVIEADDTRGKHRLRWASDRPQQEPLCVTYSVRDGHYAAEGVIPPGALAGRPAPWFVEGAHSAEARAMLKSLPAAELAVLARQGDCDPASAARSATVVLVDRRPSAAAGGTVTLMLHPIAATSVAVEVEALGKSVETRCMQLGDSKRNKAFSIQCVFPLPAEGGEALVRIRPRRHEQLLTESQHRLVWGSL
jgi:hypothetical protein